MEAEEAGGCHVGVLVAGVHAGEGFDELEGFVLNVVAAESKFELLVLVDLGRCWDKLVVGLVTSLSLYILIRWQVLLL